MNFTTLGRTGLEVSVAGLGCGGHSRLGQSYGNTAEQSVAVVAAALDAGVNFIDTAAAYRTEDIVGAALRGQRECAVVSSKTLIRKRVAPGSDDTRFLTAPELIGRLEDSLRRLQTDYIDIYNLHGVDASELDYTESELVPALLSLREQGKIRFLGITERFVGDTAHAMLRRAIETNLWDVVMVGFNVLNPSARYTVLNRTRELNIGVQCMFAVRRALSDPSALREALALAVDKGQLDPARLDGNDPLAGLVRDSGAASLVDLAYRFCRHEPGIDVVLTGTGRIDHLHANLTSINGPPLPQGTRDGLLDLFGAVDCLSGN